MMDTLDIHSPKTTHLFPPCGVAWNQGIKWTWTWEATTYGRGVQDVEERKLRQWAPATYEWWPSCRSPKSPWKYVTKVIPVTSQSTHKQVLMLHNGLGTSVVPTQRDVNRLFQKPINKEDREPWQTNCYCVFIVHILWFWDVFSVFKGRSSADKPYNICTTHFGSEP